MLGAEKDVLHQFEDIFLILHYWWPSFIGRGRMSKEKQSLSWPSRSLWNTLYFHLKH